MRLENKIAIVTGGARGIGKAVAELFTREGARVFIWDVLDDGAKTVEDIQANGGKAFFQKVSVTDQSSIQSAVNDIVAAHGKIDILINNAGVTRDRTLHKMSEEEWDTVININLKGVFNCTQIVSRIMKENKYGRIVTAASNVGLRGNFGQSNYSATKAGVIAMAKTWTMELGKYGITANCIAPGFTNTDMTAKIPKEHFGPIRDSIPVGFIAEPIDIAYGYLYLASDEGRFVSGICLTIDGGWSR